MSKKDWLQALTQRLGPRRSVLALNIYPPYLGAGIRVAEVSPTADRVVMALKLSGANRNMFGSHFGGSLYAMCDPIFALMLHLKLGDGYIVWDKAATVHFLAPGKGTVRAEFLMPEAEVARVRHAADHSEKVEPRYEVVVRDQAGRSVAHVEKVLYVRRRPRLPVRERL